MPGMLPGGARTPQCSCAAPEQDSAAVLGDRSGPFHFPSLSMPRADSLPLSPGEVCPPRRAEACAGHLHAGRTHLYHGLYQNEPAGAGLMGPGNEAAWSAAPGTWPPHPNPLPPPHPGIGCLQHPPPKRDTKFPSVPCCAGCREGLGRAGNMARAGTSQAGAPPVAQVSRVGEEVLEGACRAACPGGCVPQGGDELCPRRVPWLMCVTKQGGGFKATTHTPTHCSVPAE